MDDCCKYGVRHHDICPCRNELIIENEKLRTELEKAEKYLTEIMETYSAYPLAQEISKKYFAEKEKMR